MGQQGDSFPLFFCVFPSAEKEIRGGMGRGA